MIFLSDILHLKSEIYQLNAFLKSITYNICAPSLLDNSLSSPPHKVSVGMVGTIPKEIGYLTSLESLNFSENVLEGGIPIDTFRFLTNLREFSSNLKTASLSLENSCFIYLFLSFHVSLTIHLNFT